jgi:hypothetical protein
MADGINRSPRPDTPTDTQVQLYRSLAAATLALIGLGTVVFRWLEGWGWIDSFSPESPTSQSEETQQLCLVDRA